MRLTPYAANSTFNIQYLAKPVMWGKMHIKLLPEDDTVLKKRTLKRMDGAKIGYPCYAAS